MITKTIKILKDKKGNAFLLLVLFVFIFTGITALVLDLNNLNIKSKKIKYAMNNAVKAGALQIKEGVELSEGIFLIDEVKAEDAFYQILAHNVGLDETTLEPLEKSLVYETPVIRELQVVNTTPTNYNSPTLGGTFFIEHPTIISVMEFKVRGILLKKTIRVAKLSSSQLKSIYDVYTP